MTKSFFKRFSRAISPVEADDDFIEPEIEEQNRWLETPSQADGELTVDVYETSSAIIIKTIVAGVRKEDLEINVSRDMVSIKGKRESEIIDEQDYFHRELFWGSFSRTILLPQEIDIDKAEAIEDKGMLTLKLPKVDKTRQAKIKVRSN